MKWLGAPLPDRPHRPPWPSRVGFRAKRKFQARPGDPYPGCRRDPRTPGRSAAAVLASHFIYLILQTPAPDPEATAARGRRRAAAAEATGLARILTSR